MKNMKIMECLAAVSIVICLFEPAGWGQQKVEKGKALFQSKCVACHTIGQGKRIGPDLKDVVKRRKPEWLKKMIKDPAALLKTDPVAQQLLKEYNNVPMIAMGLTDGDVDAVIEYLTHHEHLKTK